MRYGVMNSPLNSLLQEVEALGELGFDYIEVTMDAPYAHHSVIKAHKAEFCQLLNSFGMDLVCHLPTFVSTADLTDTIREASIEESLRSMRMAAELGAIKAVLHPSFIHGLGAMLPDLARKYAMDSMARLLSEADRLRLTVCVENMFPRALSLVRPEDFDALFDRFPNAKLTLDTGHANIDGGTKRILGFIRRFPDRIGHIHASDNRGRDDDHLPIGAGTIDFAEVVNALKEIGYNETITLEVFSKDREYLAISRNKLEEMFTDA
ncbi:MAG: sugar phosphate isomerase/epimerase [Desulfobacteraceae bacterium]|nr:sugar phosphate isomerase/epimerase [Desulfobacteraceae bacterium]MCF8095257.1 sugar phosphate isomerase/epimerase [Desulfobacteraceae bacterium]